MTVATRPKSGFFIGVGCPGCGGRLQIEQDFFVTTCEHCGSVIRIVMPEIPPAFLMPSRVSELQIRFHIDRYLKEHNLPLTASQPTIKKVYYPYWKVDASLLKLRNKREQRAIPMDNESTEDHVIERDVSSVTVSPYHLTIPAGVRMEGVPETLGIRSQTVQVVPFSDGHVEDGFDRLSVFRPWQRVRAQIDNAVRSLSQVNPAEFGANLTRMFTPMLSLVYFPYLIAECYGESYRRFIVDGLSGRVLCLVEPRGVGDDILSHKQPAGGYSPEDNLAHGVARSLFENDSDDEGEPPPIEFGELAVEFHRCDNCGDDLPPRRSHVYICKNCRHVQMLGAGNRALPKIAVVMAEGHDDTRMVPFWWLKLPKIMTGVFGNLLGGVDHSDCLHIPALRSGNFEAICKLSRRMSAAHMRMELARVEEFDDRFPSVQIGLGEAVALAEMIIYRELVERGYQLPEEDINLTPEDYGLTFVPFHLENYFYVDSALNAIGVEKTLIE